MDPRYTGEMLKHLEKQSELLMDSYRSMSHEVRKFQLEEEMLMRKFYEIMSARGLTKQTQDRSNVPDNGENADCKVIIVATNNSQHLGHEVGLLLSWIDVCVVLHLDKDLFCRLLVMADFFYRCKILEKISL